MTTAELATIAQLETDLATARAHARAAWERADRFGDTNAGFELRCAAGELERECDAIAERIEEARWNDLEVEDGAASGYFDSYA